MTQLTKAVGSAFTVGLLVLLAGCGPQANPEKTADAQAAFDAGLEAFDEGNAEESVAQLTTALEIGGLSPDQFAESRIKRAISNARLGQFAAAHADLDIAEQGAALDEVYIARSYVFEKEGKKRESSTAWSEARKLNRLAKKIKD